MSSIMLTLLLFLELVHSGVLDYVDPHIGTSGRGYGIGELPIGPQVPFGMVRLGPDTCEEADLNIIWRHNGGYYTGDTHIRLFSHLHTVGAGAEDYGVIGMMPFSRIPNDEDVRRFGFRSKFNSSSEIVQPGYYSVFLEDPQVRVDLTSSDYVGVHRYQFLASPTSQYKRVVLFDSSYTLDPMSCNNSQVNVDQDNNAVSGWILEDGALSSRFGGFLVYFYAQFNTSIVSHGIWKDNKVYSTNSTVEGCSCGAYVEIDGADGSATAEIFVGISTISIDQAKANLDSQMAYTSEQKTVKLKSFDTVLKETQAIWEQALGTMEVKSQSQDELTKFYTAFYHTLCAPTTFSESGNKYKGFDLNFHDLPSGQQRYMSDMSIWDIHRSEAPWLVLVAPSVARDIVRSLILMYLQVIGNHANVIIADAYVKGVRDFDVETAYKGMKQACTQQQQHVSRVDIPDWVNIGFIPYDVNNDGCCLTLAYSYDDWVTGVLAGELGYNDDKEMFFNRSENYRNIWNDEHQFFCPREKDGKWDCPIVWTYPFDKRYVEGDAWHYRFNVPHDVPGLISLFGSNETFVKDLDTFFTKAQDYLLKNFMPNPYYWAGNEEDLLDVYLFDFAGRPDLTQKHVRWLMENEYTAKPDGLPGNDDYGTMSAWFTFGALGFYPLSGSTTYMLGSPLFDEVVFHRSTTSSALLKQEEAEGDLTVVAHNNSVDNIYVEKVMLNGEVLSTYPFLDHGQISKGNVTLEFWMTNTPPF